MAKRLALGECDQLHHFIAAGVWDASQVKTEPLVQADKLVGGRDAVLVIDDTAITKKGTFANDTLLPFVSVGLRPWANLSNASLNRPISIQYGVIAERLQFHLDRENLPEEAADLVRIAQAALAEAAEVVEESAGVP
jgi:DDE superfamily endonuclease